MDDQSKFRVLVIDDEVEWIHSFRMALRKHWDIDAITDPMELERDMKHSFTHFNVYNLIFLDLLFDKSKVVTEENARERLDREELVGIQFLRWSQRNYPFPVMVLSGNLFNEVALKLREEYPHVLLKSKPIDLYANSFRHNMEWYAQNYYRFKREVLLDKPIKEAMEEIEELMSKKG